MMQTTTTITQIVEKLEFPADKRQILQQARTRGVPQEVLGLLERLPERQFRTPNELLQTTGQGR